VRILVDIGHDHVAPSIRQVLVTLPTCVPERLSSIDDDPRATIPSGALPAVRWLQHEKHSETAHRSGVLG
jgi:hypothetical protein